MDSKIIYNEYKNVTSSDSRKTHSITLSKIIYDQKNYKINPKNLKIEKKYTKYEFRTRKKRIVDKFTIK
jgi:hypothetical protein